MNEKWAVANEKFFDFIDEGLQDNNNEKMIEALGQLPSKFSFFTVALDENDGTEFEKLYNFAVELHLFSSLGHPNSFQR